MKEIKIANNIFFLSKSGKRWPLENRRSDNHLLATGEKSATGVHARPEALLTEEHHSGIQHANGDHQLVRLLQTFSAHRLRSTLS